MPRLTPTHVDRVLWPEAGLTKRDLLDYYRALAPVLLPHLRDRPFTIKRHYTVPRGPFVWEKDAPPELPPWIRTCPVAARSRGGALVRYPLVNSRDALLWLVDYGCVDLHIASARCDRPELPDYVIFDLDPRASGVRAAVQAALVVREALEALALESVVRTSGGEGLHVLVPVERRHTYEEVRAFARIVAEAVARARADLGVSVDVKMNGRVQQFVAVYSVRPLPGAPVAAPLAWDEVDEHLEPAAFTMGAVLGRVEAHGDLHAPLLRRRQRLDRALARF